MSCPDPGGPLRGSQLRCRAGLSMRPLDVGQVAKLAELARGRTGAGGDGGLQRVCLLSSDGVRAQGHRAGGGGGRQDGGASGRESDLGWPAVQSEGGQG